MNEFVVAPGDVLLPLFCKLEQVAEEKGQQVNSSFTKEEIEDAIGRLGAEAITIDLEFCLRRGWLMPQEDGVYQLSGGAIAMCVLWLQDLVVGIY